MKVHYFVREYSESMEFPEVHIFSTEDEARATMIEEAYEAAASIDPDAWVATEMDGPAVERDDLPSDVDALNVHWNQDGNVDCFRLFSQEVSAHESA